MNAPFLALISLGTLLGPAVLFVLLTPRLARLIQALEPLGETLAPLLIGFSLVEPENKPSLIVANALTGLFGSPSIITFIILSMNKVIPEDTQWPGLLMILGVFMVWPFAYALAKRHRAGTQNRSR